MIGSHPKLIGEEDPRTYKIEPQNIEQRIEPLNP
jgi:hypothetical protein